MKTPRIVPVTLVDFHNLLQTIEIDLISQVEMTPEDLRKIHQAIDHFCKMMDESGLGFNKGIIAGFICLDSMVDTLLSINKQKASACPTDLN